MPRPERPRLLRLAPLRSERQNSAWHSGRPEDGREDERHIMVRHEIPGAGARSSSAAYGSFGIGRQSPAGLTQTSRSVMKGTRASFIEPMLCLATSSLPEGEG